MPDFQAILFDLGNTLLYFDSPWPEVLAQADVELFNYLQTAGIQLARQEFITEFRQRLNAYYVQRELDFIEHGTAHILRTMLAEKGYPNFPETKLRAALKKLYGVSQNHWQLEADLASTLAALDRQGYLLGIISNASDDIDVQTLVDKADIRHYFDFVLSSAACGIRKPNPEVFKQGLTHWQIAPSAVVMVGDTLNADVLGAKQAGIFSVWITRRADTRGNRKHAATIQPDATIETLAQLPGLLADLAAQP